MPLPSSETTEYLQTCGAIARRAGALILHHYVGSRTARAKADRSPVTDADMEANQLIVTELTQSFPEIPVVSEEDSESASRTHDGWFWLVDPLDGTRSFVEGTDEFSVNIGLVHIDRPVLGVIYSPVLDSLYYGGPSVGAWHQQGTQTPVEIHTRDIPEKITVVRSQSHPSPRVNEYLQRFPIGRIIGMSSAVKFGIVAQGKADLYPRFGTTMEWDTAAGHAIINAAGGCVLGEDGLPLRYGKAGYKNGPFVAFGRASLVPEA